MFTDEELNKIFEMLTTYVELGMELTEKEAENIDNIWAKIINHQIGAN
jgi:hypothetical protein